MRRPNHESGALLHRHSLEAHPQTPEYAQNQHRYETLPGFSSSRSHPNLCVSQRSANFAIAFAGLPHLVHGRKKRPGYRALRYTGAFALLEPAVVMAETSVGSSCGKRRLHEHLLEQSVALFRGMTTILPSCGFGLFN